MATSKQEQGLINKIKERISEEGDGTVLGVYWGGRGCGKSLKAQQVGIKIDPLLNVTNITFDSDEFKKAVITKENAVIIGDEGSAIAFSRAAMTKESRVINAVLDQCRTKRHCILFCIPQLLKLDSAILDEANFVAYVWEGKTQYKGKTISTKGNVSYYLGKKGDKDAIIRYLKKKKTGAKKNRLPRPSFAVTGDRVRLGIKKPEYPVGSESYRRKKNRVLEKYAQRPQTSQSLEKAELIRQLKINNPELTDKMIAKAVNLSRQWTNFLKNQVVR